MMTKDMIRCIAIDGTDGSGKTTIVEALKDIYNVIVLPRFYSMQMVPTDPQERKAWFLNSDPELTTAIYISGQQLRFRAAAEFKKGLHYKVYESKKEPLVVIDRGPLSVKAFSYAALKETMLTDNKIEYFIEKHFLSDLPSTVIDRSFLLFENDPKCIEMILQRRQYDERDKQLTYLQHEYYVKHIDAIKSNSDITIISPILPREQIIQEVMEQIKEIVYV